MTMSTLAWLPACLPAAIANGTSDAPAARGCRTRGSVAAPLSCLEAATWNLVTANFCLEDSDTSSNPAGTFSLGAESFLPLSFPLPCALPPFFGCSGRALDVSSGSFLGCSNCSAVAFSGALLSCVLASGNSDSFSPLVSWLSLVSDFAVSSTKPASDATSQQSDETLPGWLLLARISTTPGPSEVSNLSAPMLPSCKPTAHKPAATGAAAELVGVVAKPFHATQQCWRCSRCIKSMMRKLLSPALIMPKLPPSVLTARA
mmetsp:Transcript_8654/g.19291  ORF Transcript_8654/g.19291 Transcript_8654/m.19291 type:complete len:260 (+) Transcript_8654:2318-3097(+)